MVALMIDPVTSRACPKVSQWSHPSQPVEGAFLLSEGLDVALDSLTDLASDAVNQAGAITGPVGIVAIVAGVPEIATLAMWVPVALTMPARFTTENCALRSRCPPHRRCERCTRRCDHKARR